jgi:hypothetical protein
VISRKVWTADAWGGGQSSDVQCQVNYMVADCAAMMRAVNSGGAGIDPRTDAAALNVNGARFVPDYNDASQDHYGPAYPNPDGSRTGPVQDHIR